MTFHIALSTPAGSVMLSDSQGSTETSETHGVQKQYVGEGFLVGGAGSSRIFNALFDALSSAPPGPPGPEALARFIEGFFEREVRPGAQTDAEILIVTPSAAGKSVQRFIPGVLSRFGKMSAMELIGSGAPFAARALQRDRAIGVAWPDGSLADLLVFAHDCAEAANESLTVNDQLIVGFLVGDRAYAMGDDTIKPAYVPERIRGRWGLISAYYQRDVLSLVQSIRAARRSAYRAFSQILAGEQDPDTPEIIEQRRASLAVTVPLLRTRLANYFALYDGFLGRGG